MDQFIENITHHQIATLSVTSSQTRSLKTLKSERGFVLRQTQMFFRGKYVDAGDGREMGLKRQRVIDQGSSFYGPPASNFMYNPPAYSYVNQPPTFPVVRLRGLPFDCTETDITEFFHGLDIVDVLFVHRHGKFGGEGFCVLGYAFQVEYALQRNRQNIGKRYVEVFRSNRQEYYKAIAIEVSDSRGRDIGAPRRAPRPRAPDPAKENAEHTGILRLRGLPFSADRDDILEFFKGTVLTEDSIYFMVNSEGKVNGEAYVKFESVEDSKAAMVEDGTCLGSRYIELFPASFDEWVDAVSKGRKNVPKPVEEDTTVLRMRGLPFSAGKEDIIDFFKEFTLSEDSIHIMFNSEGRSTGEAFVEFASLEDSKAALAKDRMTLGSRYIELFMSSHDEMKDPVFRGR